MAVVLPEDEVAELGAKAERSELHLTVDLTRCEVQDGEKALPFSMKPREREMILKGLDPIALTLTDHGADIETFEQADRKTRPWA